MVISLDFDNFEIVIVPSFAVDYIIHKWLNQLKNTNPIKQGSKCAPINLEHLKFIRHTDALSATSESQMASHFLRKPATDFPKEYSFRKQSIFTERISTSFGIKLARRWVSEMDSEKYDEGSFVTNVCNCLQLQTINTTCSPCGGN
jgi:hypothetical protein